MMEDKDRMSQGRNGSDVNKQASRSHRRLKWAVALIVTIIVSLGFGLRISDLSRRREQFQAAGERRASNLSLILAAYVQGAFAAANEALRQVAIYSPRIGGP